MLDIVRNCSEDLPVEHCALLCVWGNALRKLTIKLPAVRVQLVYKTFEEREVGVWGGEKGGRREKGMRTIYARGKQAESPVRGKFTVWFGAELEERRGSCSRGQSVGTGPAAPHRSHMCCLYLNGKKKPPRAWKGRSVGWRRWVRPMPLWKLLKENRFSW